MSGREVLSLTVDRLADLPSSCSQCVFWELDPVLATQSTTRGEASADKESWLSGALLEWGSVGRIAYVDDVPAGYIMYAPPRLVPRATLFPTAPIGADAIIMLTARVQPQFQGQGLGRVLVQGMAKDAMRRGVRAVEAFGAASPRMDSRSDSRSDSRLDSPRGGQGAPRGGPGAPAAAGAGATSCLTPAGFCRAVGFKTVRDHWRYPRLRLDLRTALTWREDVEQAVERLLAQVRAPVLAPERVSRQPMKADSSRTSLGFGNAPTRVLTTSPPT